jgi:hypothetical protein
MDADWPGCFSHRSRAGLCWSVGHIDAPFTAILALAEASFLKTRRRAITSRNRASFLDSTL